MTETVESSVEQVREPLTVEGLVRLSADILADRKAAEIQILEVGDLVGYTDYFLLCSAQNERHVAALISQLERQLRQREQVRALSRDGARGSRWAVVDFGELVVHIFHHEDRDLYDLEGLWHEAPRLEHQPRPLAAFVRS
ncbi:MAG: ribosome silencing factor [Myxococcota bacterium]|nr:ribosome silencing factor [Myxococcota bacterium]